MAALEAAANDELDDLAELDENLGRGRRGAGHVAGSSKLAPVTGKVSQTKGKVEPPKKLPPGEVSGAADKVKAMGINNHQMRGIQDWVTARDHEQWSLLPDGMVAVNVSHSNLSQKMLELRFDLHQTIGEVKARLHLHHGTPAASQRLVLRDGGVDICQLDDDAKMLGFYNVVSGMEIHVVDVDPHSISRGGALENTALVEKYRMDDETYEQRKGTVREWIKEQKAADPNWKPPKPNGAAAMGNAKSAPSAPAGPPPTAADAAHVEVGSRCQVQPGARRGVVRFCGEVPGMPEGIWVGVRLDEPLGKNDGTAAGAKIFDAEPGHGTFARPKNVECGDYPDELEDSDEDEL
mmetsp:Transcript_28415/g.87913  ORF Transcript_28415/g.87913 Transcript_28415/m.87913 type:complete len:350 (+) Transcript_28415:93-1142(+)